jgi:hypothetical protein
MDLIQLEMGEVEVMQEVVMDPLSLPSALTSERSATKQEGAALMQAVYQRCAGLDVHKQSVVACVLTSTAEGTTRQEVRTFGTMTRELEALAGGLAERQVEQVVLESTGVFWWPVFNLLEEAGLPVTLVNPQHTKQLPGRKTDVGDAAWLADLLRHGLVRASFIPRRRSGPCGS